MKPESSNGVESEARDGFGTVWQHRCGRRTARVPAPRPVQEDRTEILRMGPDIYVIRWEGGRGTAVLATRPETSPAAGRGRGGRPPLVVVGAAAGGGEEGFARIGRWSKQFALAVAIAIGLSVALNVGGCGM